MKKLDRAVYDKKHRDFTGSCEAYIHESKIALTVLIGLDQADLDPKHPGQLENLEVAIDRTKDLHSTLVKARKWLKKLKKLEEQHG